MNYTDVSSPEAFLSYLLTARSITIHLQRFMLLHPRAFMTLSPSPLRLVHLTALKVSNAGIELALEGKFAQALGALQCGVSLLRSAFHSSHHETLPGQLQHAYSFIQELGNSSIKHRFFPNDYQDTLGTFYRFVDVTRTINCKQKENGVYPVWMVISDDDSVLDSRDLDVDAATVLNNFAWVHFQRAQLFRDEECLKSALSIFKLSCSVIDNKINSDHDIDIKVLLRIALAVNQHTGNMAWILQDSDTYQEHDNKHERYMWLYFNASLHQYYSAAAA